DGLSMQSLGKKTALHTADEFPDIEKAAIAIIGVLENRGGEERKDHVHLNYIRKQFYSLFPGNWDKSIADIGNIPAGNSVQDTYYALKTICAELMRNKVIPVVLGGTQDLTYAMYRAYDNLEQMVNLVAIDSRF